MKKKTISVKEVITQILATKKYTRDSDELLYYHVCSYFNPSIKNMTVKDFFTNRTYMGVPTYETVRRTRAKLQRDNETLKGINSIEDKLCQEKKRFMPFSKI